MTAASKVRDFVSIRHPDSVRHTDPIEIDSGRVRGVPSLREGVTVYKGIPYAEAPTRELRWRAPRPRAPWSGVLEAARFGDACPQTALGIRWPCDEDCLSVNVWAPEETDRPCPVLVWIHGGRFVWGFGGEPIYDGAALAQMGVVVVTFNYRLGVFGFLATPELSAEADAGVSGNYGLLDQIEALRWVQRNIAAFGGDPGRVTIAGQSAGAASVGHLVGSPLAAGLFHGAIAESGIRFPRDPAHDHLPPSYRRRDDAEREGEEYMAQLGARSLRELRALPFRSLLAGNDRNQGDRSPGAPLFRPVQDGWVLPATYEQILERGLQNDVPVMIGCNRDEDGVALQSNLTLKEYIARAHATYGDMAEDFLTVYRAEDDEQARAQSNEAARDHARVSTSLWAQAWSRTAQSPVYDYFWTHAPPGPRAHIDGAYHMAEISYFFNNLYAIDRPWTDTDREIAATTSRYIVNFISGGDPNGSGPQAWLPASEAPTRVMELGDRFGPLRTAPPDRLRFQETYLRSQPAW